MDILERARAALALIQQGRQALSGIADAVSDGKAAIDAQSKAELDGLLAQERQETQAAYASLDQATQQALGGR